LASGTFYGLALTDDDRRVDFALLGVRLRSEGRPRSLRLVAALEPAPLAERGGALESPQAAGRSAAGSLRDSRAPPITQGVAVPSRGAEVAAGDRHPRGREPVRLIAHARAALRLF
jgi:hypothetical protein